MGSREIVIPSYHPPKWWECDVFAILKSGYCEEVEIKVSVADYKNDFKKKRDGYQEQYMGKRSVKKHDLLAARAHICPNRFWYMVPSGMLDGIEIPEYAGLIEVCNPDGLNATLHIAKQAPLLHKHKPSLMKNKDSLEKLRVQLYWRYFNLFSKKQRDLKGIKAKMNDTHYPDENY